VRDFREIACRRVLILHHAVAGNHFQVSDFCEITRKLVLHAIGKKREGFVSLKFSNGNTAIESLIVHNRPQWKTARH
jgi:hypothetical protein